MFVTHDIDEAIKLGDRIAILREGGLLAQYATPAEILDHPADDFVAEFVGADRALKRLGLATLADVELVPMNGRPARRGDPRHAPMCVTRSRSCSPPEGEPFKVIGDDGEVLGLATLEAIGGVFKNGKARRLDRNAGQRAGRPGASMNPLLIASGGGPIIPQASARRTSTRASAPTACSAGAGSSRTGSSILWPALRQHVVLVLIAVGDRLCDLDGAGAARPPLPAWPSSR